MKFAFIFLTFCMSAYSIELSVCEVYAATHTTNGQLIPNECAEKIKSIGLMVDQQVSPIYGHRNVLLAENGEFIAGDQTMLYDIKSMRLNGEEGRVYVLNRNGDKYSVLSYSVAYGGNLAPRRKLITKELGNTTGFTIDPATKRIYAFSHFDGWLKSFNIHADPDGRLPMHSTEVLAQTELEPLQAKDICVSEENVYVLEGDRIRVFSKGLENESQVIEGAGQLSLATSLKYIENEKALVASNQEGPIISFVKDAEGYYAPTP